MEPDKDTLSGAESMIETKIRPKNLDRELKNLQSINPPGSSEFVQGMSGTRVGLPTLPNAKISYSQTRDAIQDELDDFFDQHYDDLSPEQRMGTDMNERFRSILEGV